MIFKTLCYQDYCLENPDLLFAIVPIILVLAYVIFRDFISFRSKEQKKRFHKQKRALRVTLLITRTLIFFFLIVGFAKPFTTGEVQGHGDPVVKLLLDSSSSMEVFGEGVLDDIKKNLGSVPIDFRQVASGEQSSLGEGILKSIEGNDNLLIISDGRNNQGKTLLDVAAYARISDTRLFAVKMEPEINDAWVEIIGPAETIEGTPNKFTVKVNYLGAQPSFNLQIFVDDRLEFQGQNVFEQDIIKKFGRGYHKITAKINTPDHFTQNNVFYKTTKAIEKPKVLFISKGSSPIEEGLLEIYDLTKKTALPGNLNNYDAIVLNDIHYNQLSTRVDDLTGYLIDGGGLFFIGGRSSFDRGGYKETLLESMLPIKIGSGKVISPLNHNIIIVLDVSESFSDFSYKEGGEGTALDLGKGMAVKMVEGFRDDISVGLVAFASLGQIVEPPAPLAENRDILLQKLKTLGKGTGTAIDQGFLMADLALEGTKGTRNIILISDGKMGQIKLPTAPVLMAEKLARKGTRIYTVGLPSALYDVDINREFMQRAAAIGGGSYFEPSEFQFLHVFFGKPEEKEKIFSGDSNLAIIDKEHFITKNLALRARVSGINFVLPKLGSRSLIFTGDGNPVLNSWNFGLGRVVTLATDDGSEWAGELIDQQNSALLTRAINYAVGNPEKDKALLIDTKDGFMGEGVQVLVKSDKYPVSQELTFTKQGEKTYQAHFSAEKEGFYQFFDALVAINAPREYFNLGMDPTLNAMVDISGGKMVDSDEEIVEEIKSFSERSTTQRIDLKLWPLGFALVIFIIELFIRRLNEVTKVKS